MKRIAFAIALGALAASGTPSVQAAPAQLQPAAGVDTAVQSIDISARRRHWRGWHRPHHVVYPHYYGGYGYYPQRYYYYPVAPIVGSARFYGARAHYHFLGVGY